VAVHQPLQRRLHEPLALAVEGAGRLVQQEQRSTAQEGACDRQALALPAGQPRARILDVRVETLGEALDELPDARGLGGPTDLLLGGLRPAVADVLPHARVEEERHLRDHRVLPGPGVQGQLAQVHAVDRDAPLGRIEEAGDEVDQRRLAGARRPDEGQGLARAQLQVEALESGLVGSRVAEADSLEPHASAQPAGLRAGLAVDDVEGLGEEALQPLGGSLGLGNSAQRAGGALDRGVAATDQHEEREHLARVPAHASRHRQPAHEQHDQAEPRVGVEDRPHAGEGGGPRQPHRLVDPGAVGRGEALELALLRAIGLHGPDALQQLGQDLHRGTELGLAARAALLDLAQDVPDRDDEDGRPDQHEERRLRRCEEGPQQGRPRHEGLLHEVLQDDVRDLQGLAHVRADAAEQVAELAAAVEAQGQARKVTREVLAQRHHHGVADARAHHHGEVLGAGGHEGHQADHEGHDPQQLEAALRRQVPRLVQQALVHPAAGATEHVVLGVRLLLGRERFQRRVERQRRVLRLQGEQALASLRQLRRLGSRIPEQEGPGRLQKEVGALLQESAHGVQHEDDDQRPREGACIGRQEAQGAAASLGHGADPRLLRGALSTRGAQHPAGTGGARVRSPSGGGRGPLGRAERCGPTGPRPRPPPGRRGRSCRTCGAGSPPAAGPAAARRGS